jgi:hypothetical protein
LRNRPFVIKLLISSLCLLALVGATATTLFTRLYAHAAPNGALWGIDTASSLDPATGSTLWNDVVNTYGKPDFVGRYLDIGLSGSEAAFLHSQGTKIQVIMSDDQYDVGSGNGTNRANQAVSLAKALGVPTGVAIFGDIENGSPVDAAWITAWYNRVSAAGYTPGYYENPLNSQFPNAFCQAITANDAIRHISDLYADEPEPGRTSKANAPAWGVGVGDLSCNGMSIPAQFWQYGETGSGSFGLNVDTDESFAPAYMW